MIKYSQKNSRIETERLIIRQPSQKDVSDVVRNLSDLQVSKWLLVVPYPYTQKDAEWFINHCKEKFKQKPQKDYGYWIELKGTSEVIGGIGLHKVDLIEGTGTVGYWLGAAHHRKGYGSEALEAVIDLAFNRLNLKKLEAGFFYGNPSSGKLLEKFCFKHEKKKRNIVTCKADGKLKKETLCYLLRSEYKNPMRGR